MEYLIKHYPLETGALEIQYIEEYFGEFPRKKTAQEIVARLRDREFLILMAEAPLPDDPGSVVPVSFKIVHELRAEETEPKLADLVNRLRDSLTFSGRKVLYSWIGGTRRDWRGQGHFRALTEESEAWAVAQGYHEVVVKTKNRFYGMRSTLDHLEFDVVKYEPQPRGQPQLEGVPQQAADGGCAPLTHERANGHARVDQRAGGAASSTFIRRFSARPTAIRAASTLLMPKCVAISDTVHCASMRATMNAFSRDDRSSRAAR